MLSSDLSPKGINLEESNSQETLVLCKKLFKESRVINFFIYSKIYEDGQCLDIGLGDAWETWGKHYEDKYLNNSSLANSRMECGINYWRSNKNKYLSEAQEDARLNFDLDARIEFVTADQITPNCYHTYSFGANCKNTDKAYVFYDLHRFKLLKFIRMFHQISAHLIAEADKAENRLQLPLYNLKNLQNINAKRSYATELTAEKASLKLSDRENEIIILYSSGCTAQQIAQMLSRSPRTIEYYISEIYGKTNCKDRKSLRRYAIDNELDGLERFFFNYIPTLH